MALVSTTDRSFLLRIENIPLDPQKSRDLHDLLLQACGVLADGVRKAVENGDCDPKRNFDIEFRIERTDGGGSYLL
ncbi:hypothetical protein EON81_05300 [bacterium]|nr:MAG: hypothetical protein EON81_05300 [bacterium]